MSQVKIIIKLNVGEEYPMTVPTTTTGSKLKQMILSDTGKTIKSLYLTETNTAIEDHQTLLQVRIADNDYITAMVGTQGGSSEYQYISTRKTRDPAEKKRVNTELATCPNYVVKGNSNHRFPSVRLCPHCYGMVHIYGSREHCKYVDNCPHCKKGFCASCLSTPLTVPPTNCNSGEWFKPCKVAKRQQLL